MSETANQALRRTPLDALHRRRGAKMVPFAGFEMPLQFAGIVEEHRHVRAKAGLFDVSHMGQARLKGEDAARALEALVPGDVVGLAAGRTRYTVLTNAAGGILDDLMVTKATDHLYLVVNASR
ncbi:MAG: glycine cleavage system aminomethyltransferase GcvT, partial [Alphaproteobacteria bacterium]|nr:glycine cleavage system aminomethyltransferase GcvT [Alphaproteobacteria bacterium]